jgi:hypothetical protein
MVSTVCSRSTCRSGNQTETGIDEGKYTVMNCFIITSPPPGQALLKMLDSEEDKGPFRNFRQSARRNASEYLNHQPVHFNKVFIEGTLCTNFLCRLS